MEKLKLVFQPFSESGLASPCQPIVHFTVVCLVTWPLSGSEAGVDLCFSRVDHIVLMLTSFRLHMKSRRVCINAKSTPASLPL